MNNEELKSCPFCGGKAEIISQGDHRKSHIVSCTNCGCDHESGDRDFYSNSSWNRRDVQSPWISTKDRLPEDDGDYWVWHTPTKDQMLSYYSPAKKNFMAYGGSFSDNISHWMPLPESPIPTIEDK